MSDCKPITADVRPSGLYNEISEQLDKQILNHKLDYKLMIRGVFFEMLPVTIKYNGVVDDERVRIPILKTEYGLRGSNHMIIGSTKPTDTQPSFITTLGYVTNNRTISDPTDLFTTRVLTKDDIKFSVPTDLLPDDMVEITDYNEGNFVVVRNKPLDAYSDKRIIQMYSNKLCEIEASRLSLIKQAKFSTLFKGEAGDQTINALIEELYNGSPYIKGSALLDLDEIMMQVENKTLAPNLSMLKEEAKNQLNELNNMVGINTIAVDKEAGISETEATSNKAMVTTISNVYIDSRQEAFDLLNRQFKTNIRVESNDYATSELVERGRQIVNGARPEDNNSV